MDSDEWLYLSEWESDITHKLRICDGDHESGKDNDCEDIKTYDSPGSDPSSTSGIIFAVAGTGADTEFAIWFEDNTGTNGYDECDPDFWPKASYCVSSDGNIDNAKLTDHCDCDPGPTDCDAWGAAPSTYGVPDGTSVAFASTQEADNSADRFCGGEL
jgi:hypothetical protein